MPAMKITCFGNLRVEVNGQPINHFDTDKTRALLVYLAVENKRPQSRSLTRSHLAGLLWSDQPEEQALHSLRQTISSLRRTLGDTSAANPFLRVERETVELNPANPVWVDVHAFQAGLDAAYRHYQRHDQGGWLNVRRLIAALALRNEPFLAHLQLKGGALFDEWQTLTREDLDQRALQGLAQLSEIYERRGEYALARQTAQRMIEIAPWDEQAHGQLMRMLAMDGQRSAAQNQYRILRRYLQEQLGVEPAGETTALFEQIRAANTNHIPLRPGFPRAPTNIPNFPTPFVGRERELDEISELLVNPACRLLTLFGPGGIGKTRLALESARQQVGLLTDGVFFIPLANVSTAEQLSGAISDTLGLVMSDQTNPHARLLDYLREKRMLLVLDNFEQLMTQPENLGPVIDILAQAPGITLLVTSRERLLLQEEWVYPLEGLRYPINARSEELHIAPDWVEQYDALGLFYQRARQAQYSLLTEPENICHAVCICQILEGLPLGVELAAAALWNHPIHEIAAKIIQHLNTFTTPAVNASPRHRSLWAAFEVSWQLLTGEEQALFCRLAVFQGGFSQDAARQVTVADPNLLSALVNQSLLRCDAHGRYSMHEAVRQYANEQLVQSGCEGEIRPAHARYYSKFLATQKEALYAQAQESALANIHVEISNARAVWKWLVETQDFEGIARCVDPLYQYFKIRSRFYEGIALFQPAACMLENATASGVAQVFEVVLAMLLARIGSLAHYARQNSLALETLERAQEICARLSHPAELAFCRTSLGGVYLRLKDFPHALACAEQNLAYYRQVGDSLGENRALYLLGLIHSRLGKTAESKRFFTAAVEIAPACAEPSRLMAPLNTLGDIACTEGDYSEAERLFQQSLKIAHDLHDLYYQAIILNNLANVYHYNHQYAQARITYQDSLAICKEIGDRDGEAVALNNLGELAVLQGDYAQAVVYSQQALAIARQIGEEWTITVCLNNLGEASNESGQPDQALLYLKEAVRLAWEIEAVDLVARFSVNIGRSLQLMGSRQEAVEFFRAVLAHTAAEHDAREKAHRWLHDTGMDGQVRPDDRKLEETVSRLLLERGEGNAK